VVNPCHTLIKICDCNPLPVTLDKWQTKALEKQIEYLVKQEILGKKDKLNQKGCLYQAFNISKNRGCSNGGNQNNQVVPMEVDAISTASSTVASPGNRKMHSRP
jgi:hypothetical protein